MADPLKTAREALENDQIKRMVDRFLSWRLPKDFRPDAGISYTRPNYAPEVDATPYGTNLLDATQAEAMVRHMVEGIALFTTPSVNAGLVEEHQKSSIIADAFAAEKVKLGADLGRKGDLQTIQRVVDLPTPSLARIYDALTAAEAPPAAPGASWAEEQLGHLLAALDLCTRTTSRKWPNAEVVGHHIAEALGLPDHDVTAEQAREILATLNATPPEPMTMLVDADWLKRKVETDPGLPVEAATPPAAQASDEAVRAALAEAFRRGCDYVAASDYPLEDGRAPAGSRVGDLRLKRGRELTADLLADLSRGDAEWPISKDGPHAITEPRRWLARQLMDSKRSDAEAFGIVAYHPSIKATHHPEAGAPSREAMIAAMKAAFTPARGVPIGRMDYDQAADAIRALYPAPPAPTVERDKLIALISDALVYDNEPPEIADSILALLSSRPAVEGDQERRAVPLQTIGEGWKLVPREATKEMQDVAGRSPFFVVDDDGDICFRPAEIWRVMYDAAPPAPAQDAEGGE